MFNDYLIIHQSVLPDYYMKVVQVNQAMKEKKYSNISEAVKAIGISRSAYYKYNPSVKAHINVVSFHQVLQDANKRNKVFLDILKENFTKGEENE